MSRRAEELERINTAWKALLVQQDPSLKDVFAEHPAWEPVKATPFQFPQMNADGEPPNTWQLIAEAGDLCCSIRRACRPTMGRV